MEGHVQETALLVPPTQLSGHDDPMACFELPLEMQSAGHILRVNLLPELDLDGKNLPVEPLRDEVDYS